MFCAFFTAELLIRALEDVGPNHSCGYNLILTIYFELRTSLPHKEEVEWFRHFDQIRVADPTTQAINVNC